MRNRMPFDASWLPAIAILALGVMLVRPLVQPVLWALIVAYATWPIHRCVLRLLRGRATLSALTATLLLALAVAGIALAVTVPLTHETLELGLRLSSWSGREPERVASLAAGVPVIGEDLAALIRELPARRDEVLPLGGDWMRTLPAMGRLVGRNAFQFFFTLLALYFVYRYGAELSVRAREVARQSMGGRLDEYLASLETVARAVLIAVPATATGQAVLAGAGYWAAGVDEPVLLTLLTALAALVPFGALLVWLPTGVVLLIEGRIWAGAGLLLWGALVVSSIDNVIRMLVIGNAVRMPFALALAAVVCGAAAFGPIGLFIGPLVAEMLRLLIREHAKASPRFGLRRRARTSPAAHRRAPSAARPMLRRRSKAGKP
ncbi:AI-2E family transporter [Caballeronia sp. SL2Y3]|uniref:AI-2E family transporter n=1 Tax=Caballeronia sp. SL2Y3 TaxID=2878151 RepID=UPI001FD08AFD|nr:AI-2E family transporter [Caballeronia sp. SL2Y3]